MVDVHNKRCEAHDCQKHPTYGLANGRARFCTKHKGPDMVRWGLLVPFPVVVDACMLTVYGGCCGGGVYSRMSSWSKFSPWSQTRRLFLLFKPMFQSVANSRHHRFRLFWWSLNCCWFSIRFDSTRLDDGPVGVVWFWLMLVASFYTFETVAAYRWNRKTASVRGRSKATDRYE